MVNTKRSRLNVTLTEESRVALDRFSEVTGIAASQLIRSIMHDSIPVIEAMTQALAVARSSPQQAAAIMGETLVNAAVKATQGKLALDEAVAEKKLRRRPSRD